MSATEGSPTRGRYKFQRVREQLRAGLESGELSGKLPGERELARRYGVNAKTIGKALMDLTCEGLLVRQVGRGTFVAGQFGGRPALGHSRRFCWVQQDEYPQETVTRLFESARRRLGAAGHQLDRRTAASERDRWMPMNWLRPSQLREVDGVVISDSEPSPELLADLLRRRIPVVLANAWAGSVGTDGVQSDFARGAYELTEHFAWTGHRRIALVLPEGRPLVGREAERGYRAAIHRNGLTALPAVYYAGDGPIPPARLQPASAMVVYPGSAARKLASSIGERGGSKSGDERGPVLGLLCAPGERIETGPDTGPVYWFADGPFVEWIVRLLLEAEPGRRPRQAIVPGQLSGSNMPNPPTPEAASVAAPGIALV